MPEVLNAAQSENIRDEIIRDIKAMFKVGYYRIKYKVRGRELSFDTDVLAAPAEQSVNSNGSSYIISKGYSRYKELFLYRMIWEKFGELCIYEVDIDRYLGTEKLSLSRAAKDLPELGKDFYAESKLALETGARYWSCYGSGVAKKAYFLLKNKQEKEKAAEKC